MVKLKSLLHLSDNQHQSDFGFSISEDKSQVWSGFVNIKVDIIYHSFS